MGVSDSDFDDRIRLTRPSPQAGANRRVSCTAARESLDKIKVCLIRRWFGRSRSLFAKKNVRYFSVDKERGDRQ
jgi:hypothetical protein